MSMNSIMTILLCVALLALLTAFAQAETVKVCAEVKLPEKGKCITRTIHGYKVRICG